MESGADLGEDMGELLKWKGKNESLRRSLGKRFFLKKNNP